jgi:hypothetical protein
VAKRELAPRISKIARSNRALGIWPFLQIGELGIVATLPLEIMLICIYISYIRVLIRIIHGFFQAL